MDTSVPPGGTGAARGSGGALRPFRFGVVAASAPSGQAWIDKARRVESLGFDTLVMPDNLQYILAALPALAMAAAATSTLRLGTYVLANDQHHPVMVAKDFASLDLLSGGRVELGLGAGRPDSGAENRMLGLEFDSGAVRVARLAESIAVIKALFAGQHPATADTYYAVGDAAVSPLPLQKPSVPILVAGSGRQLLTLAAREADIIGIGLAPDAPESDVVTRIGWIREAAGDRIANIELNINLMAVGDRIPRWIAGRLGLSARDLVERGSVAALAGTLDQMCEQLVERREKFGFSYVLVSDELMDAFAPVAERLRGT